MCIEEVPFSIEEYTRAKNAIKLGKSAGPDNVPPEVLKCCDLDDIILRSGLDGQRQT